jgi:hypothetical protein
MFTPFANRGIQIDPNARLFLDAAGITDTMTTLAINNLVIDLKDAGLWSLMNAIYPMVGGTATTNKFNLVNPQDTNAAFRLSFNGGWTHNSSGAKPDGISGTYADTFLNASTNLTSTNGSFSYYSFTSDGNSEDVEIGVNTGVATTDECLIAMRWTDGNQYGFYSQLGASGGVHGSSNGFAIINRAANVEMWRNGTRVINVVGSTASMPNRSFYLAAQNNGTTSNRNSSRGCSFSHIGQSLPTGGPAIFTTIVNNFQTALQRNVF